MTMRWRWCAVDALPWSWLADRIGLIPILRAGLGMVDAMLELMPTAQVWHLGLFRDERTLTPVEYYNKLPDSATVDLCLILDPMLAADSLAVGESPLTARETEVLRAARRGGSVADIAGVVFLSEGTVRNHLSAAIGKTEARNRGDAVRIADENGWL